MVSYIKNSTNYGLFILESDSVNNDDWKTDHDHIKEADWDLYTEGTEGIHLPYVTRIEKIPNFNINIIDFFKGQGVDINLGEGHWTYLVEGRFGGTSETNRTAKMANLELLFMKHLQLGNTPLHLGVRKIGEVWEPFINNSETIKYYLPGKIIYPGYRRNNIQQYYEWKVVFRGVW